MQHIRAVCFDLDDTLWDLAPVIPRAEAHLYDWFRAHYPRITEVYDPAKLHQLRLEYGARHPELRHDLTALRMAMLRRVFRDAGYDEAPAEDAFAVFNEKRNDVQLFDDVLPALERLATTHQLFAFTNGNASLDSIGIADLFNGIVTAREIGLAKPDPQFFVTALNRIGVAPRHALHVGDHPENDIRAAVIAGMSAVWVNRGQAPWPLDDCRPDHEHADLAELPELLTRD
ncbi:MAG: HAD family hydrolase [Gammaproteobacteria bacterium]|nr:HAD family hydrolase [Gammaproteobacteria bacterium]NND54106.1 HAD family hydrolase [Gammaproteobacteria bacterium]